jgi:hypothetical protein
MPDMRTLAPSTLLLVATFLATGCGNATDQERPLAAPTNLSVTYVGSANSWHYTFSFTAVASAESYLIYYGSSNDRSSANSLAAGQFPPVAYTYSRAAQYGGQAVYFWVRAFDGNRYGEWSSSISGYLE